MSVEEKIKPGLIFLADPFLTDPNFKRTVILLSERQDKGFVGFILNRPLNLQLADAIPEFKDIDAPLFYGGPVQTDTMHFFHTLGDQINDSIEIVDGVYWGGDFDQVRELIIDKQVDPNQFKFFLGYAGWDKPQLVEELKSKSWVLHPGSNKYVFDEEPLTLWKLILEEKGGKYSLIAKFPEDPILN
jgi:putative transcriptional regulator